MKKILIVKNGALGDVVRTSYFVKYLYEKYDSGLELYWKSLEYSYELLCGEPRLKICFNFNELNDIKFDVIYSLDDEIEQLQGVGGLVTRKIVGAYLDENGNATYSRDSSFWFDMGLISRYGKERADELKRKNQLSHIEIFKKIFGLADVDVQPNYIGKKYSGEVFRYCGRLIIGVNPFASARWKSKGLSEDKLRALIDMLHVYVKSGDIKVVLFGVGVDYQSNMAIASEYEDDSIYAINTSESLAYYAKAISELDYLITTDSLALHIAISNAVPYCAFFAPTSASEIEDIEGSSKILSQSEDYCTYRKDVDTSTITADKIFRAVEGFVGASRCS